MRSPLSSLCEVLIEVKRRARDYSPSSETQTRTALINPVLEALGWNLSNSQEVELEKRFTSGREQDIIDYILKGDGHIIVEAKKMGSDLDTHFRQILLYAAGARAKSLFLTDGLIWRHYTNPHAGEEGPTNSMNFSEVKRINLGEIENDDLPSKAAAYFVTHLDAALYHKKPKANDSDNMKTRIAALERAIREVEVELGKRQPLPDSTMPAPPWCILNETSWDPRNKRPKQLWLPGKDIIDVRGWSHVLTETCQYCLDSSPDLINPLPILDKAGRTQNLIGTERPANAYSTITLGDQELYVNTNYDANTAIKNSVYMLEKLGEGTAAKAAVLLAE